MKLHRHLVAAAVIAALLPALGGCAVATVASTAVGAAASVAGLAVDATVGTVRLTGRAVSAVVPGGSD